MGIRYENWYEYIGKSYNIPDEITGQEKKIMFAIMAITGMTFSPIGEELFFRGIVHNSFANSLGDKKASIIDSLAFSLTHISHFGLVFINNNWDFYLLPALIWVLSTFLVSVLFFQMKRITGSIWGAVICHSGFNLGMIYMYILFDVKMKRKQKKMLIVILGLIVIPIVGFKICFEISNAVYNKKIKQMGDNNELTVQIETSIEHKTSENEWI